MKIKWQPGAIFFFKIKFCCQDVFHNFSIEVLWVPKLVCKESSEGNSSCSTCHVSETSSQY